MNNNQNNNQAEIIEESHPHHSAKRLFIIAAVFFAFTATISAKTPEVKTPRNVVALSKSVAEMWLLAGGSLAGTTSDALELPDAENAVSIGSLTNASLEAIIGLNSELVILTLDIPLHKKLEENIRSLGIKTYVADVKSFSDYAKVMKDFTALTGKSDLYKKNVTDLYDEIEKVIDSVQKSKIRQEEGQKKTYLFMRVSTAKNKVLKNHFGNEIFMDLGLLPIVDDNSQLDEISMEALLAADPDYIFVVAQGNEEKAEEAFYKAYKSNPAWNSLKAVQNNKIIMLPKELFNYKPNARWAESYRLIADFLNA